MIFNGKTYDIEQLREMVKEGIAMFDGTYPIVDRDDLLFAIGRCHKAANYDSTRNHIVYRAISLNSLDDIPPDWMDNKDINFIINGPTGGLPPEITEV